MKENKIPSAEEFLKSKGYAKPSIIAIGGNDVIKLMIEFTKLHVKNALKYASENVIVNYSNDSIIMKLPDYPEKLIK